MVSNVGRTCPLCQYPIKPGEPIITCEGCGVPHHRGCWEYNGGCTTYGCDETRRVSQNTTRQAMNSEVVDLSDIMSEPYTPAQEYQPQPDRQPQPNQGFQSPLSEWADILAGSGGIIGAIIGGICGLGAGGIGCIPGALIGFFIGAVLGKLLIYFLIVAVPAMIGGALGAAGGPDSAGAGAAIGVVVGVIIIIAAYVKRS